MSCWVFPLPSSSFQPPPEVSGTARSPALVVVPLSCAGNWAREAANEMENDGGGWGEGEVLGWLVGGGSLMGWRTLGI